ncbi:MMPL family transporter [Jonesia denitrificans]|uniref:MMPL domain protein n=1 Tax=Jonesia denitrificans (strain ATCC 14870 / DSM 20603 / BCRC 15368 / CIP 55.134 / JCM 11481 / NBRC 15587 / NCTC 10816 / Prevot 55134) TaxID=471856 RepID=C7QZK0_JONDD|nr:MMPL family transporter [Jonesia denitrificans]ACV08006.1 MMPL domain protein [Jonesia denitrificans DSM 20603]SQH19983.1 Putative membrane protein ydgH [Jonesia denitrificans]
MATTSSRPARQWRTYITPLILVIVWLGAAAFGGPLFGRVEEVSTNDQTQFLPSSAGATRVQEELPRFLGDDTIPAIVLVTAADGEQVAGPDLQTITEAVAQAATDIGAIGDPSPAIPAQDGEAAQAFIALDAEGETAQQVTELRDHLIKALPDTLDVYVTGPAGLTADLSTAFAGIDGILLAAALITVLIILIVVYRSPILPFAVLATSIFALAAALGVVFVLAQQGVFLLSSQTQGILFILVIGAATDYGLLYTARYREELRNYDNKLTATKAAIRGSVEPILASGGTVIAGLLCLLLSDLESNRILAPVAATGIVFSMLAAFTLLPAILFLFGRTAFWPRKPHVDPNHSPLPTKGIWARTPQLVARRPRLVWVTSTLILIVGSLGVLQLKADGISSSDLVIGYSQAREGQQKLSEHFPGGTGSPTYILTTENNIEDITTTLNTINGVANVNEPTINQGDALISVTLTDASDSQAAKDTVTAIRADMPDGTYVGGTTATAIDSDNASIRDRNLIIPIVLLVIVLILGALLRAVVAPLILIATVVLSFGTALGVSAWMFNHVFDFPGAEPAVPLFAFVFLVALGIDYNIFLMTRVREEILHHGLHDGITRGLSITGSVITSAGIVLAATFTALAVIPVLFLVQIAFIVAFGVLLDTLLVRTLLVPALSHELGRALWWPSKLSRPDFTPVPRPDLEAKEPAAS